MPMTISELARRSGCTPPTIRFYESIGLIALAARTAGGRRSFGIPDVTRLQFIRRARSFGMSIDQVRELLAAEIDPTKGCNAARDLVQQRLEDVCARKAELEKLERSLRIMGDRCDSSCGASNSQPCSIFGDFAVAAG